MRSEHDPTLRGRGTSLPSKRRSATLSPTMETTAADDTGMVGWALARCVALEALTNRGLTMDQAEARLEEVGLFGEYARWKAKISDDVRLIEEQRLPASTLLVEPEAVTVVVTPRGEDG